MKKIVKFEFSIYACRRRPSSSSSSMFLLNYVHSAVDNFARRARVRASWARTSNYPDDRVETVFFVGLPSDRGRLATQTALEAEARRFGDIVQVDVVDSYRYARCHTRDVRKVHGLIQLITRHVYMSLFNIVSSNLNAPVLVRRFSKAQFDLALSTRRQPFAVQMTFTSLKIAPSH